MSNQVRKFGTCSIGKHIACVNKESTKVYRLWEGILQRCYYGSETHKAYRDCAVDPRFFEFQDFAEWAVTQVGYLAEDFQLDKDILFEGNRTYSPESCVFVPRQINSLFTGRKMSKYGTPTGVAYIAREGTYRAALRDANRKILSFRSKDMQECFEFFKRMKIEVVKAVAEKWKSQIDSRVYEKLSNINEDQLLVYLHINNTY